MNCVRVSIIGSAIAALAFALVACSDEKSPTEPTPFAVTITIHDADGAPIPDLRLTLAPETPYYADGKAVGSDPETPPGKNQIHDVYPNPFFPVVTIRCDLVAESHVRLCIEDIEGAELRLLCDEVKTADDYIWRWDSKNDAGEPVNSGVYGAHLVLTDVDSDSVILDESRFMLMAAWGSEYVAVGTTSDDGQIVLTDRRLFPFLYNVSDLVAIDEAGMQLGVLEIIADMRFYVTDPTDGTTMRYNREVTGSANLNFVWDPAP